MQVHVLYLLCRCFVLFVDISQCSLRWLSICFNNTKRLGPTPAWWHDHASRGWGRTLLPLMDIIFSFVSFSCIISFDGSVIIGWIIKLSDWSYLIRVVKFIIRAGNNVTQNVLDDLACDQFTVMSRACSTLVMWCKDSLDIYVCGHTLNS